MDVNRLKILLAKKKIIHSFYKRWKSFAYHSYAMGKECCNLIVCGSTIASGRNMNAQFSTSNKFWSNKNSLMRNLLTLMLLVSCICPLFAQQDRFVDINQTKGKDVYVADNSSMDVAYTIVDGKVKPIKKIKNSTFSISGKVYTVEDDTYNFKKKSYIVLNGNGETILFNVEDAPLYLPSFISKTYWQEKYDAYKDDYIYMNFKKYGQMHSKDASVVYDDLVRIEWSGLEFYDKGAMFYMSELNGTTPLVKFKVTSRFFEESKDLFFIKKNNILPYVERYEARLAEEKRKKEIEDSISNSKMRLAIALDDASFLDDDRTINVNKGDTVAVFSFNTSKDKFVARFRYANLLFNSEDIEFLDTKTATTEGEYSWERKTIKISEDAKYLKDKGDDGKEQRFMVASKYDDAQTLVYLNNLKKLLEDYNRDVAHKKKYQIFITGIGYAYDSNEYSNRFGMRFDIFNCFSKTIKYVEFIMTNYNAVGDIQRDDIGRSSRTVRGIGPIEPEDGGRYSWDDIFWDDRDVIEKNKLTNVKFIFTDGTTRVFSGYANIKKHMTSDAWD